MKPTTDGSLSRDVLRIALATAFLLLLPLVAMQFTDEVAWGPVDFIVAGILLFGAGLTVELVSKNASTPAYRVAVGVAVATALVLIWVNLAVGLIGSAGSPANSMYAGVLAVLLIGALVARLRPEGMARALLATAAAQMAVTVIAQIAGLGAQLLVNGSFAALWLGSAVLFRRAADRQR